MLMVHKIIMGGSKDAASGGKAARKSICVKAGKFRTEQFAWMMPSKGGVNKTIGTKERKYAKEHSIRYYVFNVHAKVAGIGIIVYRGRDVKMTSWLSKVADDVVRKETGDFAPIMFYPSTFYLHDENQKPIKNDGD